MARLALLPCLLLGMISLRAAEPDDQHQLVECGTNKIVLFKGKESPDGRYAIGWSIRPRNEKAMPVAWSSWDMSDDGLFAFLERYKIPDSDLPDTPYEPANVIIDLKKKSFLELPAARPHWPHKNRSDLDILWSPISGTSRHALIQCDGRFSTRNLWLVTITENGPSQFDLVTRLNEVVGKVLEKTHPTTAGRYGVFFPLYGSHFDIPHDALFKPSSVDIPFIADIPKSDDPDSPVMGMVTVNLADGMAALMPFAR